MDVSVPGPEPDTTNTVRQWELLRSSYDAAAQAIERRAFSEHGLAMVETALERSVRNLRVSMTLLIGIRD